MSQTAVERNQLTDNMPKTGLIAIVDDDELVRQALESVVKAAGFTTETFGSAEAFLDSIPMNSTKCLILDVRLPGMSGIELQRRLRAKNSGIPIIFVTAHGDASTRERAMEDGAVGFLNKPVRRQTLLDAIHAALERGQPGESPC
jgi:FixJ family two-component response regulator